MNTKIEFLYRDASNYKKLNVAVLKGEATEEDKKAILDSCDDGTYFIPEQVGLDVERFGDLTEDDHCWCELEEDAFTETEENPTEDASVSELAERFRQAAGKWDELKYAI